MTLTEFLLARLAEDEAAARDTRWLALEYGVDSYGQEAFAARVLADVEAKRRIVELYDQLGGDDSGQPQAIVLRAACMALALPFADHPDYQEAWKP